MSTEAHEEIITVINKTYPEWSKHNGWLVCVGGINDNGEWRRLYPVPLDLWWWPVYKQMAFKKWAKIKVMVRKRPVNKDPRKESHEIVKPFEVEIVEWLKNMNDRRDLITPFLSPDMETLKDSRYNDKHRGLWTSMGVIKPRKIIDFKMKQRHQIHEEAYKQVADVQMRMSIKPGTPLPVRPDSIGKWLGYKFECNNPDCRGHEMMCNDWEVCELYRKMIEKFGEDEGFQKTRDKMMWMAGRDLHLMMGTVALQWATFINVGIFYPPLMEVTEKRAQ